MTPIEDCPWAISAPLWSTAVHCGVDNIDILLKPCQTIGRYRQEKQPIVINFGLCKFCLTREGQC